MCCRTDVLSPIMDPAVAEAILAIGQFEQLGSGLWRRELPEEGSTVMAQLREGGRTEMGTLEMRIMPTISVFSQHHGKRLAAGVYFEIAAKVAEKVGGLIVQRANVVGCKLHDGSSDGLVLAHYPHEPLDFTKICAGFQAVLLGGED